jgi:hypothetical protein
MSPDRPFLLLRAHPRAEDREAFRNWFRTVHLRDARAVPGFTQIESGETAAGTFLAIYTFDSAEGVQTALASPQAAYARGTLEQWAPKLEELLIEMFAPVGLLPMFNSRS